MKLASETAAVAVHALGRCFAGVQPQGPWQWQCVAQNGALMPVRASLAEGFLHLDCLPATPPAAAELCPELLARALFRNSRLSAGVGLAFRSGNDLRLCADIAVLDEAQLLAGIDGALHGFHLALPLLSAPDAEQSDIQPLRTAPAATGFAERIRESGWTFTERGPGDFSAQLDAPAAPPATIRVGGDGVFFAVDLARVPRAAETSQQAIAAFLLTTCGSLRLVRACASKTSEHDLFALQVSLPAIATPDEVGHGLSVLSLAYRLCAREVAFLLDEDAARCYLGAREFSSNPQSTEQKEN